MLSDTEVAVVDVGADVTLPCSFHADSYSMFEHPVLWRKDQLHESSQINILGSINDPFIGTGRYEVTFAADQSPTYDLQLRISGKLNSLVAWHSGRTSVSGRRTFPVLRLTCS